MQLSAHDEAGGIVLATDAEKACNYLCPECSGTVRVRGGQKRKKHFFHLQNSALCRQNGKSLRHLQIQLHLESLFSPEDCKLECRFDQISRIADLVWVSKRLIFEVQCSPISAQEVKERNADYASEGFKVVWILHERCFSLDRKCEAEKFLENSLHYYSNIDEEGNGVIYDCHLFEAKHFLLPKRAVNLLEPKAFSLDDQSEKLPYFLEKKHEKLGLYFSGDYLEYCLESSERNQLLKRSELALSLLRPKTFLDKCKYYYAKLLHFYHCIFQIFLESKCR
jgi:competence protein CoiA